MAAAGALCSLQGFEVDSFICSFVGNYKYWEVLGPVLQVFGACIIACNLQMLAVL